MEGRFVLFTSLFVLAIALCYSAITALVPSRFIDKYARARINSFPTLIYLPKTLRLFCFYIFCSVTTISRATRCTNSQSDDLFDLVSRHISFFDIYFAKSQPYPY